jgi:hypothetical protein
METVWFGVKLAFGLAFGFGVIFLVYREVRGFLYTHQFVRVGCTYQKGEKPGTPSGWFTRDIQLDDYLLWDDAHGVCLRMADASDLHLWDDKQKYAWAEKRGLVVDDSLDEHIIKDSLQWNLSNESLKQFLTLAHEYEDLWKNQRKSK